MMIRKEKTIMMAVALACLLPVLVLTGCVTVAPTPAAIPSVSVGSQQEGLWVTGQGEVKAAPDVAVINLGVQAQAPAVAEAQNNAKQAMDAVISALKINGIAEKDIQTTGYNIWQQTRWDNETQQEIVTGYQVSNSVQVKIRKVADAGVILDAAVAAGGDFIRVQGIYFQVDDPSSFLNDARAEAVADARARAEQLADLNGVKLGKPTYITESYYNPIIPRSAEAWSTVAGGAPTPTPIAPGETTITATVQIVYSILL